MRIAVKPHFKSLSLQISVLSAASLLPRDDCINLSLRCFSMLRSFLTVPNTGAQLVLSEEAKQCVLFLCNMHRAADVLGLIVESVEELQNKQTPAKRRKVRFCVERRPCNPELGLQVLRQLLESPHLQSTLLKRHTVPLFDTWNVLLRIAKKGSLLIGKMENGATLFPRAPVATPPFLAVPN
ncbi:hypothetical protein HPB51_011749 [Rhipicephalus microplus]|uniref:Uncharacterized protein n=1 Tax=Rhipicephalus microplus TaxID=6941 RepID=A0A9J6DN95_RHIMP|nr:hypothetical protein HPB51_011749 [Rhipicephalus microplus]